jgi:hypothetical protein
MEQERQIAKAMILIARRQKHRPGLMLSLVIAYAIFGGDEMNFLYGMYLPFRPGWEETAAGDKKNKGQN